MNKLQWFFYQNTKLFIHENASENIVCETAAILSKGDELMVYLKHRYLVSEQWFKLQQSLAANQHWRWGSQAIHASNFLNTLRPRQNGRHFADDMFKWIFLNENVWSTIEISLKFVPKGLINNNPALFQIMAWRRPGKKTLSEPMMVSLATHICVIRPQWVKYTGRTFWYNPQTNLALAKNHSSSDSKAFFQPINERKRNIMWFVIFVLFPKGDRDYLQRVHELAKLKLIETYSLGWRNVQFIDWFPVNQYRNKEF